MGAGSPPPPPTIDAQSQTDVSGQHPAMEVVLSVARYVNRYRNFDCLGALYQLGESERTEVLSTEARFDDFVQNKPWLAVACKVSEKNLDSRMRALLEP